MNQNKFNRARGDVFNECYPQMYPEKSALSMTFIVTHQCNLRCTYCYEHNKQDKSMSFETAKKAVDILFASEMANHPYINSENADCLILEFIGGEPLLEIELIAQIVDYFREKALELNHRWLYKYMINITSNGVAYDDPRVEKLLSENAGRISIAITIDGDEETHDSCRRDCNGCGSYHKAAAAFTDVRQRYEQDGTKFTIAPGNVHRTFIACTDIIERFDLESLFCNCVYEEGWEPHHANTLYFELKKFADWLIDTKRYEYMYLSIFDDDVGHERNAIDDLNWCGGTGKMLAIDVDGVFYPCLRYAPLSIGNRPPLRIGDIENGLVVLQSDKDTVDMLNAITCSSQSTQKCLDCPIASGCGWCSAYNYEYTGTPDERVTFICVMHQARVLAMTYYWNRVFALEGWTDRVEMNVPKEWALEFIDEDEYNMLVDLAKTPEVNEENDDE